MQDHDILQTNESSLIRNHNLRIGALTSVLLIGGVITASCADRQYADTNVPVISTYEEQNFLPTTQDINAPTTIEFTSTITTVQQSIDTIANTTTTEVLPKNPIDIAIFGDSIVYGYKLDGMRWTDLLQNDLTSQSDFKHVTIQNFAVPGQSIVADIPVYYDNEGARLGGRLVDLVRELYPENSASSSLPEIVILVPSINEIVASKQPTIQGKAEQATMGILGVIAYFKKLGVKHVKVTQMLSPTERWSDTCSFDVNYAVDYFNTYLSERIHGVAPYSLESTEISKSSSVNGSDEAFFKDTDTKKMPNDGLHPDEQGQLALKQQVQAEVLKLIATFNR
ncbi:hypothetical protein EB118_15245 [bacterium]|nr:hypothetical protein [bacterium]NBX97482.1 hypothetical protein [bacterium]NDC95002.1 hypothetical protein [bacterium]NDD82897.1 hypothetical protein [bacterium]NDG31409.1 hypothetical protein [bacterium]